MVFTEAWQNNEHAKEFGKAGRKKDFKIWITKFQRYIPARCLNYLVNVSVSRPISVLDVGCASGNFYAYLSSIDASGEWTYKGLDISKPAIEFARKQYGQELFDQIGVDEDLSGRNADIVLSIDVFIHQVKPFEHLNRIINTSNKFLVVRLRTRDNGETVLDPAMSCQMQYGEWVPWIVCNTNELYEKILEFSESPVKISSFKRPKILAGEGDRYLPKELYLENSKTALTTLIIEKCEERAESHIVEYEYKNKSKRKHKGNIGLLPLVGLIPIAAFNKAVARMIFERVNSIEDLLKYTDIISKNKIC